MGFDDIEAPVTIIQPINPDGSFGKPIRLEKLQVINWWEELEPVTDFQDDLMYKNSFKFLSDTISGTLKCNMQRKMSRKKFKKWLMHYWWCDRNYAEQWCYLIGIFNGRVSYTKTYFDSFLSNPKLSLIFSIDKQLKETEK